MMVIHWVVGTLLLAHKAAAGGQVWLRMHSYADPTGTTASGECCDGFHETGSLCFSLCDLYFDVCMDANPRSITTDCAFSRIYTNYIKNQNEASFDKDFGGIKNPYPFSFTEWPVATDGVTMIVNVWDDDTRIDDFVERLTIEIPLDPSTFKEDFNLIREHNGTSVQIVFQVGVECDMNYYSPDCVVYCSAQDDESGHYDCDADGAKVCHPGWEGENCQLDIDECANKPCENGGACTDLLNGFRCSCLDGYVGDNCEIEINACEDAPCENGATCERVGSSFVCHCPIGFVGATCADIAYGNGHIIFKMISYDIPEGLESNGNCCDGFSWCTSACDPYFQICFDKPDGPATLDECAFGEVITGQIDDTDNLEFGSDIGGVPNPIEIPFSRWYPEGLLVKVDIWDKDYRSNDDFIQYFGSIIEVMPSINSTQTFTFQRRTSLTVEVSVRCDPGYSGVVCSDETL